MKSFTCLVSSKSASMEIDGGCGVCRLCCTGCPIIPQATQIYADQRWRCDPKMGCEGWATSVTKDYLRPYLKPLPK